MVVKEMEGVSAEMEPSVATVTVTDWLSPPQPMPPSVTVTSGIEKTTLNAPLKPSPSPPTDDSLPPAQQRAREQLR